MSVDPRCADVRISNESELDAVARELHGKRFRQLSDDEGRRVWDVIAALTAQRPEDHGTD